MSSIILDLILLDSTGLNPIDTIASNKLIIESGVIDANGKITTAQAKLTTIPCDGTCVDNLNNTRFIILRLSIGTTSVNDENYIKLNGVKVEVKQDDKIFKSVLTTSKGKYLSMELPFGFIYRVTFSKDKFASKSILLDAKNGFFPDDPQKNFTIPLTILLQSKQPDIDYSLVTDQDVAKFKIINGVFQKDPYIKGVMSIVRSGSEELFMDRLIIASIAELRGSERFKLIGEVVDDPKISKFYTNLYVQELEHINSFIKMSKCYFDSEVV